MIPLDPPPSPRPVAKRSIHNRLHQPGDHHPVAGLPAGLPDGVRRRAVAHQRRAGVRLPARLHVLPVRVHPPAVGGVRRDLHRVRGGARLGERVRPAPPGRGSATRGHRGRIRDRRARPLCRDDDVRDGGRADLRDVIDGPAVDLVGLFGLALLVNMASTLFATGVAMRARSMQAGPAMQIPVFIILFLAPVYVPLDLLRGWIHGVASYNPATLLLEAGRALIAGSPEHVLAAFAAAVGLAALFCRVGAQGPAQGRSLRVEISFGFAVMRGAGAP